MIYKVKIRWNYFHNVGLTVNNRLDKDRIAEAALADNLELPILLHNADI